MIKATTPVRIGSRLRVRQLATLVAIADATRECRDRLRAGLLRGVDALAITLDAIDRGAGGRLRIHVIPNVSSDWLRVVVRQRHPLLRHGTRLELAHLAASDWLLPPASTPTRQLLDHVFLQAAKVP